MKVLEPGMLGGVELPNRILRSATFEGLADEDGMVGQELGDMYFNLARNQVGGIITGFLYINKEGRAIHPGQAGLDSDAKIRPFKKITDKVHETSSKIFAQLAHAGRQTSRRATGGFLWGVSPKRSSYFGGTPDILSTGQALEIAEDFARAALRAREAGFDGIQIHAAHGYLVHQFILPNINNRKDQFGVDPVTGIGTAFVDAVISSVRTLCGDDFPILFKLSGGDKSAKSFTPEMLLHLVRFLNAKNIDGIEISHGTMEQAFNIFRGASIPVKAILNHNYKYKTTSKVKQFVLKNILFPLVARGFNPFTPCYNLAYAREAKKVGDIPVITVGGFRTGDQIEAALDEGSADFVALARPLLCEPDFVSKIINNVEYQSVCSNCNQCAVMCDSPQPTRCYDPRSK